MSIANAHTAMQDGDLSSALEMLQHRLEAMPDDVQTIQLLIRCHLQRNELREAGDRLRKLLRQPSQDATTFVLTGDLYSRTGQIQQAAQAYRQALRLQPDAIEALHGITLSMIGLQKLDQARDYLQQALSVAADHPVTRRNMGLLHRCMAPRWHFPMVNDIRRNNLFVRAVTISVDEHCPGWVSGAG
nr:tetratricopeptide repeat protein [Gammaproteobacteria bacterium]